MIALSPLPLPSSVSVLCAVLQPLADTLSKAAASCGRRNLRIVLEAVSTTCSVVGSRVLSQHPAAVQQLVVPLLNRWQAIGFVERDVVPIMEALNNMSVNMGPAFEPYAQAVFEKGVMLLQLQQEARAAQVGGELIVVIVMRLPASSPGSTKLIWGGRVS